MIAHVFLGFEVGTGQPVEIPIGHMVVTGQTQAAGKTTTLEALVQRSGVRAMAFRTKRGEGGFQETGKRIAPYFRERADWRFVSAILEASLGERMKFERSWIMRATKGARTLADVQANVRSLGAKAKGGMSADMFMMLGEYLDGVVPELQQVDFAPRVELYKGANVVDLGGLSVNVQGLVISSMLSWVHEKEDGVVAVLPEAWKFIPQGRNSPVRMAAIAYAREGGTLGNLIWLDSQDLAGAEKEVVRAAGVYLLGVQREANEIKRTLDHIPAGTKKPKAAEIATLERGQFYACWGTHAVKVYVQPAWLDRLEAKEIALGRVSQEVAAVGRKMAVDQLPAFGGKFEDLDPRPLLATARAMKMPPDWPRPNEEEEDEMKPEDMKTLAGMIGEAVGSRVDRLGVDLKKHIDESAKRPIAVSTTFEDRDPDRTARRLQEIALKKGGGDPAAPYDPAVPPPPAADDEAFFRRVLDWLQEHKPEILRVLVEKPQVVVEVELVEVKVGGGTLRGRIAQLLKEGYLDQPKGSGEVIQELKRRGGNASDRAHTGKELDWFAAHGFCTLELSGFQVVKGMKIKLVEK